jgi:hypothetical protein
MYNIGIHYKSQQGYYCMKAEQEATPALKQEVVTSFDGDE